MRSRRGQKESLGRCLPSQRHFQLSSDRHSASYPRTNSRLLLSAATPVCMRAACDERTPAIGALNTFKSVLDERGTSALGIQDPEGRVGRSRPLPLFNMAIDIAGSPCLFMEGEGLLFVLLGGLTLRQLLKMHSSLKNQPSFPAGDVSGENSPAPLSRISLSGGQTRFSFISLLFASSLCRAVALFGTAFLCRRVQLQTAELLLAPQHKEVPETPQHNAADSGEAPPPAFNFSLDEEWIVYLLDSIPSLIFCSAVSLVILFWARIYYAANLVAYPLFSRMHSVLSVVLFVSYAFCVSVAVLLQAKRAACAFLQGLEALLFGTEAIAFLFYGIKVAKKVSERGKSAPRKSSIVRRVIFLSMVCPVLFGLRSFMAFKGATPPLHPLHTLPEGIASSQLLAGQIYFLTEWVPTLLILFTFWHRKGGSARSQQHRPSTVPAEAEEEMVAGSFDSTIMAPLMQQNVYPFTPSPPHPQAQGDIAHGAAMPSEVYPQFMHPQVPYRDSFSNYGQTTSPSGYYNAQYPQQGQH